MRTTVTLDDEVVLGIRSLQRKRPDISFKRIINDVMKKGLEVEMPTKSREFKIRTFPNAKPKPGLNFDNIEALLSQVEGDDRKW